MMKDVLSRRSLSLALAIGVSLVGFGSLADAGGPYYRSGCQSGTYRSVQYQPMSYHSVQYQPMSYHSAPYRSMSYRSSSCQTMTYRSVPCRTVSYRSVPCPPVQYAPPCIPSGPPTEPTPEPPPEPPPSGVLLEVVDQVDPLEVGSVETYVITVTNQGEILAIDNIEIIATLPEQLEYVSSEGPTEASAEGQVVRFAPLETLDAGEEVEYRLKAKAVGVGDIRFQVELTTDQSPEPINETESTNLYE